MGEDYYPVPWTNLKYDINLGGYVAGITEATLKSAPKYSGTANWEWSRETTATYQFYQAEPFGANPA